MTRIRIVGHMSGLETEFDGQYVVEYDPSRDGDNGLLFHLLTTADPEQALDLPMLEAMELWRKVDPRHPIRPDGAPNRPLTAFSVELH